MQQRQKEAQPENPELKNPAGSAGFFSSPGFMRSAGTMSMRETAA
ncbi:hypothetical protein [Chlorobium sp.]